VLNGYAAELSSTEAKRLATDPAVASVEQDQKSPSTAAQANVPRVTDSTRRSRVGQVPPVCRPVTA